MCFNHIRHLNRMLSGCRAEHGFKQRHKWSLLRVYSNGAVMETSHAGSAQWEGTGLRVQRWLVLRGKNDTSFEIREKSETGGGEHCRDTTLPDRRDALIAMWSRGHFLESAFSWISHSSARLLTVLVIITGRFMDSDNNWPCWKLWWPFTI